MSDPVKTYITSLTMFVEDELLIIQDKIDFLVKCKGEGSNYYARVSAEKKAYNKMLEKIENIYYKGKNSWRGI